MCVCVCVCVFVCACVGACVCMRLFSCLSWRGGDCLKPIDFREWTVTNYLCV